MNKKVLFYIEILILESCDNLFGSTMWKLSFINQKINVALLVKCPKFDWLYFVMASHNLQHFWLAYGISNLLKH